MWVSWVSYELFHSSASSAQSPIIRSWLGERHNNVALGLTLLSLNLVVGKCLFDVLNVGHKWCFIFTMFLVIVHIWLQPQQYSNVRAYGDWSLHYKCLCYGMSASLAHCYSPVMQMAQVRFPADADIYDCRLWREVLNGWHSQPPERYPLWTRSNDSL